MKQTRQRFWMCLADEGETPKARRYSQSDAHREAEWLARKLKQDVFVLEASEVARCIPPEPPPPDIQWQKTRY